MLSLLPTHIGWEGRDYFLVSSSSLEEHSQNPPGEDSRRLLFSSDLANLPQQIGSISLVLIPQIIGEKSEGGKMADTEAAPAPKSDEEAKRQALAAKKAEVRKRLEEAGKKGKKKKGFLTPERKKKLRKLLMIKAAENLKNQQKQLDSERQNVLSKRIPQCPNIDAIEDKGQLEKMYNDLFQQMLKLEEEKYDINFVVSQKDAEISEITISVNDLRGKFVKPTLKKVSKYDNKFRKAALTEGESTAPKEDFRSKLKTVEKKNVMEELESKQKNKAEKPEWTKKVEKDATGRRASQASSKGGGASEAEPTTPKLAKPTPEEAEEEEEPEVGDEEEDEE
ncbi:hypothetical protein niasHS_000560 [Heterodera schachtii]|uniref:Troponin I n=2 Tax=Heterodera TaxID=34509 RepID=A0ABD2I5R9_HETSC